MNSYRANDHVILSKYILAQKALPWVMSYDDDPLIRELYESLQLRHLPIRYSLQSKKVTRELLIAPWHVRLPANLQGVVDA
jgi:DNA adenine methylase